MSRPRVAPKPDLHELTRQIRAEGQRLGFQQIGVSRGTLQADEQRLGEWLAQGCHGSMAYMARHGSKRSRPAELVPGTVSVISARMDYLPPDCAAAGKVLADTSLGYVSRYALGRDYHKVLRRRLQRLADRITATIGPFGYRVFVDSAPVLEKALARDAGLGWIGKHTNLINRRAGSWFFLGEIYTDLPLPAGTPVSNHCGSCTACLGACPTGAIVEPYRVEARLCISYLTIEHRGSIAPALRRAMGSRIYGCDDCQLVCPWNRYARSTPESDFLPRHGLDAARLIDLFDWSESLFLERTAGSPIRRIGYQRWLRNIAVALGNAPRRPEVRQALLRRANHASELVREHVAWALQQQGSGAQRS
jgi:epoxyqueuosine reductase